MRPVGPGRRCPRGSKRPALPRNVPAVDVGHGLCSVLSLTILSGFDTAVAAVASTALAIVGP